MSRVASILFFLISIICVIWVSSGLLAPSYSQSPVGANPALGLNPSAGSATRSLETPGQQRSAKSNPAALEIPGNLNQVESFSYDPTGRRDPFRPYGSEVEKAGIPGGSVIEAGNKISQALTDLQGFDLAQLRLIGISWGNKKASAVIKDPSGKYHVIRKFTKIGRGNGFVALIREGEVVIVEPAIVDGVSTAITRVLILNT